MHATCRPRSGRAPGRALAILAWITVLVFSSFLLPQRAAAQVAEIQVYQGEMAAPGQFSATLHSNYTPDGRKTSPRSGIIASDGTLTIGPEIGYGISDWLELGMLAPIISASRSGAWQFDGAELRALFTVPHAESRTFFYGVNLALVISEPKWNQHRYAVELRPIIGWHIGNVDLVFNPILDSELDGFNQTRLTPASRLAYRVDAQWAFALEHYADIGAIKHLAHGGQNSEQLFAVADYYGQSFNTEMGIGFGTSSASDNLVLKLIISRELD